MKKRIKENFRLVWMVSCILILLIPIFASALLTMQNQRVLKETTLYSNELVVQQVQKEMEGTIDNILKMKVELLDDPTVFALSSKKGNSKEYQYEITQVYQRLKVYKVSEKNVSHFFIYFPNIDTVISSEGVFSPQVFYNKFYRNSAQSFDGWKANLVMESNGRFIPGSRLTGNKMTGSCMLYYCSLKLVGQVDVPQFCAAFDQSYFQTILDDTNIGENDMVLLIDSEDRLLLGNGGSEALTPQWLRDLNLSESSANFSSKLNRQKVEICSKKSPRFDWHYTKVTFANEFWRDTNFMLRLSIFGILISLVLGGLCIWGIIRINYTPLEHILSLFRKIGADEEVNIGEYQFIEKNLKKVIIQRETAVETLDRHRSSLQHLFFTQLLRGETEKIPFIEEAAENLDIHFVSAKFMVAVLYIENYDMLFAEENIPPEQQEEMAQFILGNILEELFGEIGYAKLVVTEQTPVLVINLTDTAAQEWQKAVTEKLNYAHAFILDQFGLLFREGLSGLYEGADFIENAYREANGVVEYKVLMDDDEIMFASDIPDTQAQENGRHGYSIDLENKLIGAIQSGNISAGEATLNEIFVGLRESNIGDLNVTKYFLFDIGSTMLKTMAEIYTQWEEESVRQITYVQQLLDTNSISKIQEGLQGLLREFCGKMTDEKGEKEISERVKLYIRENYMDMNLNVAALGPIFGIVSKYLSRLFKEAMGIGLLDYINQVRIEEAKKLLVQTELRAEEVSERVGYSNISTFLRVFKKYTGTTPGKYREQVSD